MKRSTILTSLLVVLILALLGFQEWRFRRQLEALRAEHAAAAPATSADSAAELAEAVRQLSQARSELATAQHRLTTALQQVNAQQAQVQAPASQTTDFLGPRRLTGRRAIEPAGLPAAPSPDTQPGQPVGRSWGEEQATGPADTFRAGDISTAWAPRLPDGGEEWLNLEYPNQVQLAEVRVRETYNPGAISKVVAILPNGQEQVIWEGVTEPTEAPVDSVFPVTGSISAKGIKVYLDTRRVPGWNEIDAVEIVGRDGTRQWASHATASSSYAEPR